MTAKNRAGLITKLQSSLKKHYKPAPAAPGRPLLEHILYAALLEDAPAELADEGFAMCEQEFFDWNEVRVTSVTELAEVLSRFPSPATTAARLKRVLQNVFEGFYNFDLDHLKKENLSKAVAKFETMNGLTPFVLAYLTQHGLGGHAIPVSSAAMQIMLKAGIVSEAEAATGKVPGLERAIPKSKAIEFSSMLHQAAVALQADPRDPTVWEVITAVNQDAQAAPEGKPSKPKTTKRASAAAAEPAAEPTAETSAEVKASDKPAAKTKAKTVKAASKTADTAQATDTAQAAELAAAEPPSAAAKPATAKPTPAKSSPAKATKSAAAKPAAEPPAASAAEPPAKKSGTKATKKSGTGKAATSKSAAGKDTAPPSEPAADEPPAAEAAPSGETAAAQSEPVAGSTGSQKLSKQKPR